MTYATRLRIEGIDLDDDATLAAIVYGGLDDVLWARSVGVVTATIHFDVPATQDTAVADFTERLARALPGARVVQVLKTYRMPAVLSPNDTTERPTA